MSEPLLERSLDGDLLAIGESIKKKLLYLCEPIARDLQNIVVAWLGRDPADNGQQLILAILRPFAHQAVHGELTCLAHRKIVEIANEDLDVYASACRRRLIQLTIERCHRLCPCEKTPPPPAKRRNVTSVGQLSSGTFDRRKSIAEFQTVRCRTAPPFQQQQHISAARSW